MLQTFFHVKKYTSVAFLMTAWYPVVQMYHNYSPVFVRLGCFQLFTSVKLLVTNSLCTSLIVSSV